MTVTEVDRGINSRRSFLRRVASGAVGLATVSAFDLPVEARAQTRQRSSGSPDEAYWRQVKAQFAIKDGIVPLNAANLCPAPRPVIDAVTAAMRDVEGDVSFQNRAKYSTIMADVRMRLAAYLGAAPEEIAIVRNTSEANNIVVGGLRLGAGDEVLLFDQNHPTNNVAWDVRAARYGFTVKRVTIEGTPSSPTEVLEGFRRALTRRTRVLSFSDVSNNSGLRLPTRELCGLARERNIYVHMDGAQTFGALVRDLHALGCDSYAASAHKWFMGPKEAGVLFVRAERIAELWPGVVGVGWGSAATTSARGARKFETLGQRNDATIAGVGAALRFHESIGPAIIEARIHELASALITGLAALPGARMVTPANAQLRAGVVIVRFDGVENRRVYERLYAEHGIAGAATGGLRLCPHVYITMTDIERTIAAVRALVSEA